MSSNLIGLIISFIFVFMILILGEILNRFTNADEEFNRKFVHIGVSNWWIVAMFLIDNMYYAMIPPIIFIILNYLSYKKGVFSSMEREDKDSLGTVYYPISLLILVLLFWERNIYIGAIGILIMGYGDGLAALIGVNYGLNQFHIGKNKKSIIGTLTMFAVSMMVSLIVLSFSISFSINILMISIIIAFIATVLELVTPYGLDNITVPLISALVGYILVSFDNSIIIYNYRFVVGLIFSGIIGILAYKKKSLTKSGMIGAIVLGTGIYLTTGFYGASTMILFFISSSVLSHYKKRDKKQVSDQFDKTGNRDMTQVFANGGVGLIYGILYLIFDSPIYLMLFTIAFAAANADTWSTEIGILDKKWPFHLRSFKRVPKGTSGAVSPLGTISGFLGALLIAVYSSIYFNIVLELDVNILYVLIVSLSGLLGSVIDSMLGAFIQGIYMDEERKETEKKFIDGKETILKRGIKYINNDIVNVVSIFLATLIPLIMVL
ncbi:DUF92 domain-containing protein [Clostridium sp. D2Q-11]|uniref:DUF92 domain-containing protein n=1 Tax=Anaeromonas frigoriresistens TaxID=2683708 RepID=A0A942Z7I6_9FIRM|nr:DUF92 domain-containing protein [Anaeromonas frigoriresistens]MBS4539601.1 DUF92 domain-containing protein [Anaeromonas frigoriresistens]